MRLGSDLRTLLLRPVSTSHRLSISAQKDTAPTLPRSHAPPVSRRSIVTASFRLTLPHHIPQEGLLSSSSPVYEIQFGKEHPFHYCRAVKERLSRREGEHLLLPAKMGIPQFPSLCQGEHNLISTPGLFPCFRLYSKKRPKSFFLCSLVFLFSYE